MFSFQNGLVSLVTLAVKLCMKTNTLERVRPCSLEPIHFSGDISSSGSERCPPLELHLFVHLGVFPFQPREACVCPRQGSAVTAVGRVQMLKASASGTPDADDVDFDEGGG